MTNAACLTSLETSTDAVALTFGRAGTLAFDATIIEPALDVALALAANA